MKLVRLAAEGFRNLEPFSLDTDAHFVVFHGANAQGKTNALEAIWLLATLKPLRGRRTRDLVRWGGEQAAVVGDVDADGIVRKLRVDLEAKGRTHRIDDKPASLDDYFRSIRAIVFTPADAEVVSGEPERRRRWLDRAAFTAAPAHLQRVNTYRRCLSQKSAALREDRVDEALLDVLDDQLAQSGAELVHRRVAILDELSPHVRDIHATLSQNKAGLSLRYRTHAEGDTIDERRDALRERLARDRETALRRRMSLVGPQTDDLVVQLEDHAARSFASRGQVRSVVLALKLAEMVAARARGEVPIFLLDDVSSELDRQRTGQLVGALSELSAQVFVTTTDPGHIEGLPEVETRRVLVEKGQLKTDK